MIQSDLQVGDRVLLGKCAPTIVINNRSGTLVDKMLVPSHAEIPDTEGVVYFEIELDNPAHRNLLYDSEDFEPITHLWGPSTVFSKI